MELKHFARLSQEFGNFQLPDRGGVRASLKMAEAYLDLEAENFALQVRIDAMRDDWENERFQVNLIMGFWIVIAVALFVFSIYQMR